MKASPWPERLRSYGLLFLSAVLMFLGFGGFGVWPLAFVGMVPALFVFDADPRPKGWRFFWRALFFGFVAYYGGFYWVVDTIVEFGGFPYLLSLLFGSVYFLYQALHFVLVLWLWRRGRERGFNPTLLLVTAYVAVEMVFPQLFDHFYGNSFWMLTPVIQVVDLGGPLLLTALAMLGNGAVYELIRWWREGRRGAWPRLAPLTFVATLVAVLVYGFARIGMVEAAMADAPVRMVGIVQGNMDIHEKRRRRREGRNRHIEQSLNLERQVSPDLIVWSESAASYVLPSEGDITPWVFRHPDGRVVRTPTLLGGLRVEGEGEDRRHYNTAFITDASGHVQGTYDKTYLLAFGEYIPFGDWFPSLYDASPNSGHFTPGDHVHPLPFGEFRIGALVCYEDILPGFVRRVVRQGDPHLLVNITNDAWFGDSQEPYVHLNLARFRAVEHHRYLVRSTATGVSAIIDPVGRVTVQSGVFERASISGEVRMMRGWTPYQTLGDWPGWLALGGIAYLSFIGRRRRRKRAVAKESGAKKRTKRQRAEEQE